MLRSTNLINKALSVRRSSPMIRTRSLGFMGDSFNPFDDPFDPLNPINQVLIQNQKGNQAKEDEKKSHSMPEPSSARESTDQPERATRPRLGADY